MIAAGDGDELPVSAMPVDGTFPTGTAKWEKRNIAQEIPVWDPDLCIQCGKCVMVCPHAVIRAKVYRTVAGGKRASAHSRPRSRNGASMEQDLYTPAGRSGRLHRLRAVRRSLPGKEQDRGQAQGASTWAAGAAARSEKLQLGVLPESLPERRPQPLEPRQVKDVAAA